MDDRYVSASPAEDVIAGELGAVRPDLIPGYRAALPGARAAVLTRLWRGLAIDPLPWVVRRETGTAGLTMHLTGGLRLRGPHPDPYATAPYVTGVELDGRVFRQAGALVRALGLPYATGFAEELDHSTASLALSRAGAAANGGRPEPVTGWEWEQRVVDGHPYHPNCRSRPGFSVAEQLAYAPEHGAVVELGLAAVPAEASLVTGEWPDSLRDGNRVLIPVHPWQAAHVLKSPPDGPGVIPAHPLMSLRTLAPADGTAPHIKTALSSRLTSSVRDISVYSVETAAAVSEFARILSERLDGKLHFTRTLGAATAHSPELAAVLREAPEVYADAAAGERVVPVGALEAAGLTRSPDWLHRFAPLALSVCLRVLELGVALEAHGQNLLVVLSADGEPLRLVYRDLADVRISPARLARHGLPVPPVAGRLITDDETTLRRKLFGSLLTGALGSAAGSAAVFAEVLAAAMDGLPATEDSRAVLAGPLPTKALTLMRLSPGVTGDQWTTVDHPLG
ncbi:iron transporter [Streptomyces venezuelae]|uniref:Iron transporter n=1 Tax=Streptomyces venezuelae TaxID=54571 RepID=A0A5P2CV62_STRVZ|nr:IucA/IucC family siderophore biosynthesis protein [Streptomyces venezuelae]QES46796.1 iron transporter [Streptomyces venezuelae]